MLLNLIISSWVLLETRKWRPDLLEVKVRESSLALLWVDLTSRSFSECCKTLWSIRTSLSLLPFLSHQVQSRRGWRAAGRGGKGWELGRESLLLSNFAGALGRGDRLWHVNHHSHSLKSLAMIVARLRLTILMSVFPVTMPDCPKLALDISPNSSTLGLKEQYTEDYWRLLDYHDLCVFPEVFRSDSLIS